MFNTVFLVDYENCHYQGLMGARFLTHSDLVHLFWSDNCSKLPLGVISDWLELGVGLKEDKLVQTRKNGLDFYIATVLGQYYQQYKSAGVLNELSVVIVSNDTGYEALQDYYSKKEFRVVIADSIGSGLVALGGRRADLILARENKLSIKKAMHLFTVSAGTAPQVAFAGNPANDSVEFLVDGAKRGEIAVDLKLFCRLRNCYGKDALAAKSASKVYKELKEYDKARKEQLM